MIEPTGRITKPKPNTAKVDTSETTGSPLGRALRQAPPWMKMKTGARLRRARYMSNRSISAEP
jgi:hypothetical protein